MTRPLVPVSVGELYDKLTILEIKSERIADVAKLDNVNRERLALLEVTRDLPEPAEFKRVYAELKRVNEALWDIEDQIRLLERDRVFGSEFVELARSVYITNDRRAQLKQQINSLYGSELVEEKSYEDYGSSAAS